MSLTRTVKAGLKFRVRRKAKAAKRHVRRFVRRRRSAEEARAEALASARRILLEEGPNAVTLQNVAADIGMVHSNLLHHFGSAGELQLALMVMMVRDLTLALEEAVVHMKADGSPRALIDIVFDAFDKGGAGRLAAWIALSGNMRHLESIQQSVDGLVKAIREKFSDEGAPRLGVQSAVLFIALFAFGDAVVGERLKAMLGRAPACTREIAAHLLPHFFEMA
jgi:TetR/AcrR family transcriptional regulator, repressor for neighboring sulfatase